MPFGLLTYLGFGPSVFDEDADGAKTEVSCFERAQFVASATAENSKLSRILPLPQDERGDGDQTPFATPNSSYHRDDEASPIDDMQVRMRNKQYFVACTCQALRSPTAPTSLPVNLSAT